MRQIKARFGIQIIALIPLLFGPIGLQGIAKVALLNHKAIPTIDSKTTQSIGKQIWQNEANCREDYLTFWSEKESFPSLGIGHNIWLPEEHENKYTQGFPALCAYLRNHGVTLPTWLEKSLQTGAPWKDRTDFYNDTARLKELRQLLVKTIALQAQFMVDRLEYRLLKVINAAPKDQRKKITKHINLLLASPIGAYVLIDYLNFKGDGLNPTERSNGQSWGLLSVLQDMPKNLTSENVIKAFTVSAAKRLIMLIEHSEPEYNRLNFFSGWMARLNTYTKKNI